jgi:hypothetical protein
MDIAIRQETGTRRLVANATQLNKVTGSPATWGFLDWSRALPKGINVSRGAAFSLGAALVFVSGGAPAGCGLNWPGAVAIAALSRNSL